ncbi:hypothetical protein AV530_003125 [Patagioenas fasciata monilis]|uniref:Uncharacterized protein n=1 Tax=Patagioenas fasciata monilis TaxID=372326 RepID=A0A1V4KW38_PATFA|nr:hypothetical protein AV530_003125 [Patagioenas fasciata monilis]
MFCQAAHSSSLPPACVKVTERVCSSAGCTEQQEWSKNLAKKKKETFPCSPQDTSVPGLLDSPAVTEQPW